MNRVYNIHTRLPHAVHLQFRLGRGRRVVPAAPPRIAAVGPTLNALVDVAAQFGVDHVVFSSVTGADSNRVVPHHRVETHLQASDLTRELGRPISYQPANTLACLRHPYGLRPRRPHTDASLRPQDRR